MSYKYKEKIKEDLEYSLAGVSIDYYSSEELIHKQKIKELDHVYAQAAKADEYEAKAKAYDDIRYAMEMQTAIGVSDEDTLIDIEHVIIRLIESGGSDD